MPPATIKEVRVAPAHDGVAELIVCLEYDNGGTSEVALDQAAGLALMQACAAHSLEDLKGQPWEKLKDALQVSYNRFSAYSSHKSQTGA